MTNNFFSVFLYSKIYGPSYRSVMLFFCRQIQTHPIFFFARSTLSFARINCCWTFLFGADVSLNIPYSWNQSFCPVRVLCNFVRGRNSWNLGLFCCNCMHRFLMRTSSHCLRLSVCRSCRVLMRSLSTMNILLKWCALCLCVHLHQTTATHLLANN